mgnify:FL=1
MSSSANDSRAGDSPTWRALLVTGLVALYGIVMVPANHGVGPIALLLVVGRDNYWLPGMVLGYSGLLICVVAMFRLDRRAFLKTLLWGLAFLGTSVVAFGVVSSRPEGVLLWSLPLAIGSTLVVVRYRRRYAQKTIGDRYGL